MKALTIVGAGISGLYLAYLLQEKFEITILEARERIGGRIFALDGHDMGPSWVWQHHIHALWLIESLELELFRQYTKGYALYDTKDKLELFSSPASTPSFRIKGSLSGLTQKLHQSLKSTKILYKETVQQIDVSKNIVNITTESSEYKSDFVILTLPPRLAVKVHFTPELPTPLLSKMKQTQTWMGNSAKCVVEFKKAFWREKGLSGFVFSHLGPLGEIHDACTKDKAALFGFVNLNADISNLEQDVKTQMIRLFDIEQSEIVKVYFVDWKRELFTSVTEDTKSLGGHPQYGIDTKAYSQKVLFSSTEFSFEEGGYIEGALIQAKKIVAQLEE